MLTPSLVTLARVTVTPRTPVRVQVTTKAMFVTQFTDSTMANALPSGATVTGVDYENHVGRYRTGSRTSRSGSYEERFLTEQHHD